MNALRARVSQNRVRFQKDNFDLDLSYITDNIIGLLILTVVGCFCVVVCLMVERMSVDLSCQSPTTNDSHGPASLRFGGHLPKPH